LALAAALAIGEEEDQLAALTKLAPYLTGESLASALDAVVAFRDPGPPSGAHAPTPRGTPAQALAALAPRLTGDLLARGLSAALQISWDSERIRTLEAFVPQLTDALLREALNAVLSMDNQWSFVQMLIVLAPRLTGELLERALQAALKIEDNERRAKVLASLSSNVSPDRKMGILERELCLALDLVHEERANILVTLGPYPPENLKEYTLETALALPDERGRAELLIALAPQLSERLLGRAVRPALALTHRGWRKLALAALVPRVSSEIADDCIEAALALTDIDSQGLNREAMLRLCANKELFTVPQLRADTIVTIAEHIVEICQEWQWL
jgi:hypothetical protein